MVFDPPPELISADCVSRRGSRRQFGAVPATVLRSSSLMCPGLRCSCTVPSSSSGFRHKFPSAGWYWSVLESPGAACGGLHRPLLLVGRAGTGDLLAHRQSRFANAPSAPKIRVTNIGCLVPSQSSFPRHSTPFAVGPFGVVPQPRCHHHVPCTAPPTSVRALRCQSRSTPGKECDRPASRSVMDAAACVRILDRADAEGCVPVIWNHWRKTPTDPARIATLVMGRAVECCAPIVVSDVQGIHEVVELSNRNKIPARRTIQSNGEAIIHLGYAWGWKSAFKWLRNTFRKLSGPAPSIGIDHWP